MPTDRRRPERDDEATFRKLLERMRADGVRHLDGHGRDVRPVHREVHQHHRHPVQIIVRTRQQLVREGAQWSGNQKNVTKIIILGELGVQKYFFGISILAE